MAPNDYLTHDYQMLAAIDHFHLPNLKIEAVDTLAQVLPYFCHADLNYLINLITERIPGYFHIDTDNYLVKDKNIPPLDENELFVFNTLQDNPLKTFTPDDFARPGYDPTISKRQALPTLFFRGKVFMIMEISNDSVTPNLHYFPRFCLAQNTDNLHKILPDPNNHVAYKFPNTLLIYNVNAKRVHEYHDDVEAGNISTITYNWRA